PISVLFEAPTIALSAALIRERLGDTADGPADGSAPLAPKAPRKRFTHLVAMHDGEGGERTPFFLVAGMFGNVLNLRHLARLLGADRPFYGMQARGLYGDQAPHETFEEAATDYIAEMRQVQPHGPYLLGGFSGGGITAYEIVRQLEASGERVSTLIMLDTPLPQSPSLSRLDKAVIKLAAMREQGSSYLVRWIRQRWAWELQKREKRLRPVSQESSNQLHNSAIEAAFRNALPRYRVALWSGAAVLFRPSLDFRWKVSGGRWVNTDRELVYPDNNWSQFMPALQVFEVPGDHDSMVLEPNVRVLASLMKECIVKAEAERDLV
ncbi:MAG TPA: polyketide synthase, partial [Verrucomicrobiales bacterium]|nr:polyketide synthase [Verrucomicrobiales bacterium]